MFQNKNNIDGFTLVELLIAMVITGFVMASIYSVYYTQQRSYMTQEQVAAMQQNLRAGMSVMTKDIRMAGFDPVGILPNPAVITADETIFKFYRIDDSGATIETIRYQLFDSGSDSDDDLGRQLNTNPQQAIAENIDALNFVYLDGSGVTLATPVTGGDLANIRSVQVSMIARADRGDPGYVNNTSYFNQQSGVPAFYTAPSDNFRRKMLSRQIKCRNLGL